MCGIAGYIGKKKKAVSVVLEGIGKLEYRGYDSAGVGTLIGGKLCIEKRVGGVGHLQNAFKGEKTQVAIAHTRWATHGVASQLNAHPHCDFSQKCAVVHNGIIENHEFLRKQLLCEGIECATDTDSEVIPHLIQSCYKGDLLEAVKKAIFSLKGAYAIVVMHQDHPGELICAAKGSPLALGIGEKEMFIASDPNIFLPYTREVIYLHSSELAKVTPQGIETFDDKQAPIVKKSTLIDSSLESSSKGNFAHYTLKEIYEQPETLARALNMPFPQEVLQLLKGRRRIVILGCGTSYHAGLIAGYALEERARIPVEVHISSEYRYRNPIVDKGTLALAISQSGETADTLAALTELKKRGAAILGICNVPNSTLTRVADGTLFLGAGREIGVCSTKAFTSQLMMLSLLACKMDSAFDKKSLQDLERIPEMAKKVLSMRQQIQELAKKYARYENFFYLGRRYMYPTALEGALKLKEMAYVNANGYAAGEMKHGPIALIDQKCPTVACLADKATFEKMESNLFEVRARSGKVLAFCPEELAGSLHAVADEKILLPSTCDEWAPILTSIALQLFAYEMALERGCEIDQPRNLAKSVTVE